MRIPDNLRGLFGWIIAVDVSYDLGRLLLSLFLCLRWLILVVGLPMGLHSGVTFRLERGYKCGYADVGCSGCKWVLFC